MISLHAEVASGLSSQHSPARSCPVTNGLLTVRIRAPMEGSIKRMVLSTISVRSQESSETQTARMSADLRAGDMTERTSAPNFKPTRWRISAAVRTLACSSAAAAIAGSMHDLTSSCATWVKPMCPAVLSVMFQR